MNKLRRSKLSEAIVHLDSAIQIISDVRDDEQDAMDNIPENLQSSDMYNDMENAVDTMEDAIDELENISDCLGGI